MNLVRGIYCFVKKYIGNEIIVKLNKTKSFSYPIKKDAHLKEIKIAIISSKTKIIFLNILFEFNILLKNFPEKNVVLKLISEINLGIYFSLILLIEVSNEIATFWSR